jgi:predicted nucleic acid-binding protein
MNGWLLETHVATRLASRFEPEVKHPKFVAWLQQASNSIFFSAIFITQIADVAGFLRRGGKLDESVVLLDWLEKLAALYGERILPVDAKVARTSGEIICELKEIKADIYINLSDLSIAATARAHGLTLLTTEPESFKLMKGITCVNPFDSTNFVKGSIIG